MFLLECEACLPDHTAQVLEAGLELKGLGGELHTKTEEMLAGF